MKIEDLVSDKNRALFDRVDAVYKVELNKGSDHTWGSVIKDNIAHISYSDTSYPEECFTHELLHIDAQIKGYKRIRAAVSLQKATHRGLPTLVNCLDNELQHHKMYKDFVDMKYLAQRFYHDSDIGTSNYLKESLQQKGLEFRRILVLYFTAIAPGGAMAEDERADIKKMIHDYSGGIYRPLLQKLDAIIEAWIKDTSYDAEDYIKQICNLMDDIKTWITYGDLPGLNHDNFPSTGFFTDKKFTIDDVIRVHGR